MHPHRSLGLWDWFQPNAMSIQFQIYGALAALAVEFTELASGLAKHVVCTVKENKSNTNHDGGKLIL